MWNSDSHITALSRMYSRTGPQMVAGRAGVVEGAVDHPGRPGAMAGVDEPFQPVRAAVGLVHGIPEHAVVAPVPLAIEVVDRQDLHVSDAQPDQVAESFDRGVEGAPLGERADVQLVDHRVRKAVAGPVSVGPGEVVGVELAGLVDAMGLSPGSWVGQYLPAAVQQESVWAARKCLRHVCSPPAAVSRFEVCGRCMALEAFARFADRDLHPSCTGRPDTYFGHQDFSASNRATGYSPSASASASCPEQLEPVNTSWH